MKRLEGKVALVTGGGKGIGKEIALAFATEGAAVVIAGRDVQSLEAARAEIAAGQGKALAVPADVGKEEDVRNVVRQTVEAFGAIDILVNNSGVPGPVASVAEMNLDEWNRVLSINLTGSMLCSREVLQSMIPRKKGAIICIASEGGRGGDGRAGYPRRSAYASSKMGMIGLAETMAVEVGRFGIRVNSISPAAVRGERIMRVLKGRAEATGVALENLLERMFDSYSLGRMAEEKEIASVAVFLASDESAAITGQVIVANCGHHILH